MKISFLTGTYTLLLCACACLMLVLPAIDTYTVEQTGPVGLVAGIAVGGTVDPTPENTLYQQLQEERQVLEKRAQQLDAQQRYQNQAETSRQWLLAIAITTLFGLILTNFYLDQRRAKMLLKA